MEREMEMMKGVRFRPSTLVAESPGVRRARAAVKITLKLLAALSIVMGAAAVGGCDVATVLPRYPNFNDRGASEYAQANSISARLQQYIEGWMAGKNPATIPSDLVPSGVTHAPAVAPAGAKDTLTFQLESPSQVNPQDEWLTHVANTNLSSDGGTGIDLSHDLGGFPEPNATYLILPDFFLPFGDKAIMTGQFPHSRFFDVQISPPFNPYTYYQDFGLGVDEVPIVDADISPDPGSSNPFEVGADRDTPNRNYTLSFNSASAQGLPNNGLGLNPSWSLPYWRGAGNTRTGGGLEWTGPNGCPGGIPAVNAALTLVTGSAAPDSGTGCIDSGDIWVRYYAPDLAAGPYGGVPLPKVLYQLPDGRQFFIQANLTQFQADVNSAAPVPSGAAPTSTSNPTVGWDKTQGVIPEVAKKYGSLLDPTCFSCGLETLDERVDSHGEALPAPGNYENVPTTNSYNEYLSAYQNLPAGDVLVLTGQLPTTPQTQQGQPVMTAAQARMWSITGYSEAKPAGSTGYLPGQPVNSLMDSEITTNNNHEYIIAYSRPQDRPDNATTANGVTWANYGPETELMLLIRWTDVGPQWTFCRAPNQKNLGWTGNSASPTYQRSVMGYNTNTGFLGNYQPVFHVMTKAQFEALGSGVLNPDQVPSWTPHGLGPPVPPGPTNC